MGRFKEDFVFTLQAVIGDSLLSLFHLKSFPGRASRRYRVPYCISSIGAFGFRDASRPDLPGVFSFCFSALLLFQHLSFCFSAFSICSSAHWGLVKSFARRSSARSAAPAIEI